MKYLLVIVLAACGGKLPETRYYQLAVPATPAKGPAGPAIAVEPLAADAAYDDDRIVYRLTPYRLDYYNYHRWSSPPGTMLGNYLQDALSRSGRFRAVLHDVTDSVPVTLGGRVIAIEEVDKSKTEWIGRVAVELTLTDTLTNKVLWSQRFDETEPLTRQSPEGLAQALSVAMQRITDKALPEVVALCEEVESDSQWAEHHRQHR
jgi:ABC-type uncharacterized transport system auxiliary subunit